MTDLATAVLAALGLRRRQRREPTIGLVDLGPRRRHADRVVPPEPSGYDDDRPGRTWTYRRR